MFRRDVPSVTVVSGRRKNAVAFAVLDRGRSIALRHEPTAPSRQRRDEVQIAPRSARGLLLFHEDRNRALYYRVSPPSPGWGSPLRRRGGAMMRISCAMVAALLS